MYNTEAQGEDTCCLLLMHVFFADKPRFPSRNGILWTSYFSSSVETAFFGTCHVKVTMSCLVTIFIFFWLQLLFELLQSWELLLCYGGALTGITVNNWLTAGRRFGHCELLLIIN
uniref:Secreted protein n=1 Tax=Heterorhabditis bacteriophora TaxID=37862 RepID=A0A1I7WTA0_HETBA